MKTFYFILALGLCFSGFSQIGIGTTNPDQSAALDVQSTTKGFLPPRLTQFERDKIVSPATGLMIWCSDCGSRGQLQVFDGTLWFEIALGNTLSASGFSNSQVGQTINGNSGQFLGTSVAINGIGNRIILGAPGISTGQVTVYQWDGSNWNVLGTPFSGPGNLGQDVDISEDGNRIAISAPNDPSNSGSVFIYEWDGSSWNQLGNLITAPAGESDPGYGTSIALSGNGNRIVIGYPEFDDGSGVSTDNYGLIQMFEWNGSAWSQLLLTFDTGALGSSRGSAVALNFNGDRIAATDEGEARVRLYGFGGQLTSATTPSSPNEFGKSISLDRSGDILAIGGPDGDCIGSAANCGLVLVLKPIGGQAFEFVGDFIFGSDGEGIGSDVSLTANGNRMIVGGNLANSKQGLARIYQLIDNSWIQIGSDILGIAVPDQFGTSVAISGNGFRAVIGAPETDGTDKDGYVQVFE